jgi:hypothetical protein
MENYSETSQERIKIDFLMNNKTTNYKKKYTFETRFTILKMKNNI